MAEADENNVITRYYIHGLGLLGMVTPANQVYTYHFNAIGSTIAITDSTQAMVNKYSYTPFGVIVNETEAIPQPFKFVGQFGVMAEPGGFYYMRARYYDPSVGRFISEDPIGFASGEVNFYVYAANNPINYTDPYGLFTPATIVGGGIAGGIAGGITGAITGGLSSWLGGGSWRDIAISAAVGEEVLELLLVE